MKSSIYAVAIAATFALAGSASAQMVNGVASPDQQSMAPVGTKAPSNPSVSSNAMTSNSMASGSMSGNTAMNSGSMKKSKKMKSSTSAMSDSSSPKLVNGVSGTTGNGMAPVGTKAQSTGQ